MPRFELGASSSRTKRSARLSYTPPKDTTLAQFADRNQPRCYHRAMRVLRLGNSVDAISTVPDEGRAYRLVERMFEERTGQPLKTSFKRIEPRPTMPLIMDRWMAEFEPDIALLIINQFWYGYASAPKKLEKMGRTGKLVARAGFKAAAIPWVAHNPVFRFARGTARRTVGASYLYEPEQVVESMKACITLLREKHAGVPLGVWSENAAVLHGQDKRLGRELLARRKAVHGPLREFCAAVDVPHYLLDKPPKPIDFRELRDVDHIHLNAAGHQYVADTQLDLVLELAARARAAQAAAP